MLYSYKRYFGPTVNSIRDRYSAGESLPVLEYCLPLANCVWVGGVGASNYGEGLPVYILFSVRIRT